jgi:hypothetical protein
VAAGLIADRGGDAGKLLGSADFGFGSNENSGGRDGIGVRVELAMADGCGDVDGTVKGAADIRAASLFEGLEGSDLVA